MFTIWPCSKNSKLTEKTDIDVYSLNSLYSVNWLEPVLLEVIFLAIVHCSSHGVHALFCNTEVCPFYSVHKKSELLGSALLTYAQQGGKAEFHWNAL